MKHLSIFLFILLLASPAFGYEKIFREQCKSIGVPKELALAIAKQESGLNPLCINVAGKDYWPDTKEKAEAIIREAQKKNASYDVGLMQINSQWIRQWGIDPVSLLDPATNIRYGLRILKDEINRYGLNWRAIGAYHSQNPLRAMQYARMVQSRMKGSAEFRSMLANRRLYFNMLAQRRKFKNSRWYVDPRSIPRSGAHLRRKPLGYD